VGNWDGLDINIKYQKDILKKLSSIGTEELRKEMSEQEQKKIDDYLKKLSY
jgi:hypothetical protein